MHQPHLQSGGRYPVLRAVALLFMINALVVIGTGVYWIWYELSLPFDTMSNRIQMSVLIAAATFFGVLITLGVGEVIKLFMDIEYNTRRTAHHTAPASGTTAAEAEAGRNGPGIPLMGNGDRKWMDGDETAEGALIRGH